MDGMHNMEMVPEHDGGNMTMMMMMMQVSREIFFKSDFREFLMWNPLLSRCL